MYNLWRSELLRLLLVVFVIGLVFQVVGNWLVAVIIGFSGYIIFLLYKLFEIYHWLNQGGKTDNVPEGSGILGHIIRLIYRHKKNIEESNELEKAITRQFNETISAIPSATIVLNQHNEIDWANYPSLTLLGINGQRDVGIKIDLLIRNHTFVEHLYQHSNEQFEMTSPVSTDMTLAIQLVNFSERKRLLIAHDISPHIAVQRSRKTFIANASHELRTPLTVIAGYLDFMQSEADLPLSLQRPVTKAIEQSENMKSLINDLLALSKLEDNTLKSKELSEIHLDKHLEQVVQTLEAGGRTSAHTLYVTVDEGLTLYASQKELDSVCFNLINNAVKYSEPETTITISWRKSGRYAIFSVTDEGIGIAPEHIQHLTERFYRVDSGRSRRVGGTGLGLSIVKHIVERHNGRMEIHSRVGEGSTFSVILPITPLSRTNSGDSD